MPETCSMAEEHGNRFQILCYEQVERLHRVMETAVPIHGRGNFPTLEIKLKDLILVVQTKLRSGGIHLRDVRLNGGAASYILGSDSVESYNDLDLIFGTKLNGQSDLQRIKDIVMQSLLDFLPRGVNKERMSGGSLNEAYVHKMVKIYTDSDRWSLISLSNARGRNVELKFADIMRRQFEFSVDSFQIILDSLLTFYDVARTSPDSSLPSLSASSPGGDGPANISVGPADKNNNRSNNNNNSDVISIEKLDSAIIAASKSSTPTISEHFYPTVVAESMYGSFDTALTHLNGKLISTRNPEEIRGGGLLKYCYLLARGYRPTRDCDVRLLERYMCSRFFIDFPDVNEQRSKLVNYLADHFVGAEDADSLRHRYLRTLYAVVEESTVCLMGHERRQTLDLIRALADNVERFAYCRSTGSRRFDRVAAAAATMYQPVLGGSPALSTYPAAGYPAPLDASALYPSLDVTNANLIIDQVYYGPFTYPALYPGGEPQQYYTVCTYEYSANGSPCGVSVSSSSSCASPSVGGPFSTSINSLGAELSCGLSLGGRSSCSSGVGSMGSPSCSGLSSPSCLSPAGSTLSCPYCESCDLSSDDGKELDRDDLVEVEDGLIS